MSAGGAVPGAWGQVPTDAFLNRQRALEEQVRSAMDTELPADQKVDLDWGGWYSFNLLLFDDAIEASRTYRRNDLRVWGSASLDQGAHQFYGRLKLQYQDFNSGDSFDGNDDDWVGPNLDRGYYQFDLRRAMRAYRDASLDWNLNLKVGRDYAELGTGYALSLPMDHVLATAELGDWRVRGLAGTSVRSTDDIDRSRPNAGNSERNFYGTEVSYTGLAKHEPFVYFFYNEDQHREGRPIHLFQNFDYDSWYLGLGSTGELATNLRYSTEWLWEGGHSFGDRSWWRRDEIKAWAFDALAEYLSPRPTQPRFSLEYMFAGGDPNRTFSPTDALGGNAKGDDRGFVGFGYRDTGLSFAPSLSNVHIWRAGAAFKPFESVEWMKDLELGTNWFLYWKNRRQAAVSDPTANVGSGFLGWEMDYLLTWRLTSDLSWTTGLGTFFPGAAFSDQTTRTFFLTGVTWSF